MKASEQITKVYSVTATEDITKKRLVAADGTHTANARCVGVSFFDVDSGDEISVKTGIVTVEAGGEIAVGDAVESDADGKAIKLTVSAVGDIAKICGYAYEAATGDGDEILIRTI